MAVGASPSLRAILFDSEPNHRHAAFGRSDDDLGPRGKRGLARLPVSFRGSELVSDFIGL